MLPPGSDARVALRECEAKVQTALIAARRADERARETATEAADDDALGAALTADGYLAGVGEEERDAYTAIVSALHADAAVMGRTEAGDIASLPAPPTSPRADVRRARWHAAIEILAENIRLAQAAVANPSDPSTSAAREVLLTGFPEITAQRLLQVEAVLQSLAPRGSAEAAPAVAFEFMRLSTTNTLAGFTNDTLRDKSSYAYLYGGPLGHFAGFIRGSWRAHDWMIGRLDGAAAAVRLVLNGRRVAEAGVTNAQFAGLFSDSGLPGTPPGEFPPDEIPDEQQVQAWQALFTEVAQTAILDEELPKLREALQDEGNGWSEATPSPGDGKDDGARAKLEKYLRGIDANGGTEAIVWPTVGSNKGARLAANTTVVASQCPRLPGDRAPRSRHGRPRRHAGRAPWCRLRHSQGHGQPARARVLIAATAIPRPRCSSGSSGSTAMGQERARAARAGFARSKLPPPHPCSSSASH